MGANLCCFSRSRRSEPAAGEVKSTRCYRIIPHRDTEACDDKVAVEYKTLNEYFLASPAVNHAPPSGKVFAYKSSPEASAFHTPRVSLSSPDQHAGAAGFFSPRLSFSTAERLGKIEETNEKKELSPSRSAMMSRSRSSSGKFKKKVTFKLPENADVVVFCTPHESFEDP
ncbi:PREDICTED: uncharacterized protein LOC109167239 [Ipomoea nil]|uniref:uncharacterized protein LOC109167239 n=1 Tax=Ipomoea nil TaxID=35883 RepID=UPI0009014ACB|nr:PREDICTED: uncharacterized protein LOC109167239 [Ipomoea nil]